MSSRGRKLFDDYVANVLNNPSLTGLSLSSHVFNLNSDASEARIGALEMTEEVGPLLQALVRAKTDGQQ